MPEPELLKKDLFGEIRLISAADGSMIVRDTSGTRLWIRWLARWLLRREAKILALFAAQAGLPELLSVETDRLERTYLRGRPMQVAQPRDPHYFQRAKHLLRKVHQSGVVHNDLAKEPNVLVDDDGIPAFIDFQLAWSSPKRGRVFRILAYEDLRHLLKHKRTYCPEFLSRREQRILDNPAWVSRAWMSSVKPLYLFVTRRLLRWSDREGASDRGSQKS